MEIVFSFTSFFHGPLTQVGIYHTYSRCSFECHASAFPFLCESSHMCLVINMSYNTCIPFVLNSFSYSVWYLPWLATSYTCTSFTWLVCDDLSIHLFQWLCKRVNALWATIFFKIPSQLFFGKWSTCTKRGFPLSPSPHSTTSQYSYHQIWLLNLSGHLHSWSNLFTCGTMCILHNNACNGHCYSRQNEIIHA